ncbi:MAG TPA: alkyl sulfatase dimerization domain-containing protein [Acidimicrobiales bacterium]|nr:alkyl sulfatase dimerization domain-containing protein [Acidimicrobiales bacterium]
MDRAYGEVMADLLALSARLIDEGDDGTPPNRVTTELSEVTEDFAVIEAFSHVVVVRTGEGPVIADTSSQAFGAAVVKSLRAWTDEPVHTLLYTHGHIDHVGGAGAFVADAAGRGDPAPRVVGHEKVLERFDRYDLTNGYNGIINQRQFGNRGRLGMGEPKWFSDWVRPDKTFRDTLDLDVGGVHFEFHHDKGETDDHLWGWLPEQRAILAGDFLTWVFPNAGNPQKVQRFPREWAVALRAMAEKRPELLLPAHGLPIGGADRIARVLDDVAGALESLVARTLELMNAGERLDRIVHEVRLPEELLAKPYLRPIYDEPEFVVRNIWRLYGGWYDGNPSHMKPAPDAVLAAELASLAGGATALAARARELVADRPQLAAQLVEWAAQAAGHDPSIHEVRADVYEAVRKGELSLMSKGIYGAAARDSREISGKLEP